MSNVWFIHIRSSFTVMYVVDHLNGTWITPLFLETQINFVNKSQLGDLILILWNLCMKDMDSTKPKNTICPCFSYTNCKYRF